MVAIYPGMKVYSVYEISTEDRREGDDIRFPEGTEITVLKVFKPGDSNTMEFLGECDARLEWFQGLSQRSSTEMRCTCVFYIGAVRGDAPTVLASQNVRLQWGQTKIECTVTPITNTLTCTS